MGDKLVLGLFNLLLSLGAELVLFRMRGARTLAAELEGGALGVGLDGVERQPGPFNVLPGARGEAQVCVESRVPASQEAALDL